MVKSDSSLQWTHFMKLPTNSPCADVASRGSLELGREQCNRGRMIFTCYTLSTLQPRSVSLGGLPYCGWAVFASRCFHFIITALTVDRGSSSMEEMWLVGKVASYDGATLKVTELRSKASLLPIFVYEIAWLCAWFHTPVSNVCGWNSHIHSFEGVSTYFCIYSVYMKHKEITFLTALDL